MSECRAWAAGDPIMEEYHDHEWCKVSHDDDFQFEMLCLEGASVGLSWRTIMHKREAYRTAFHGFRISECAKMTDEELEAQLTNDGIIRNRSKIFSVRKNAQEVMKIQEEYGSFDAYLWAYVDGKQIDGHWKNVQEVPAVSEISEKLSKDLRKRGMSFVGPVITYSFMQSIGMVNDHLCDCEFREAGEAADPVSSDHKVAAEQTTRVTVQRSTDRSEERRKSGGRAMEDMVKKRNRLLSGRIISGLKSRNMTGYFAEDAEEAKKIALSLIPEGASVTMGGCMSAREIGLVDALETVKYNFIDRDRYEDKRQAMLLAYDADVFLSSANAMTEDGVIINIDGNSNRVSAIAQGPRKVILIVGMNKICPDADSAMKRARNVAAPINAQRFGQATPCAKTGACMDCKSPDTICCQFLITRFSKHADRIHVILVNESLGF